MKISIIKKLNTKNDIYEGMQEHYQEFGNPLSWFF
jgi:hypothetical protein